MMYRKHSYITSYILAAVSVLLAYYDADWQLIVVCLEESAQSIKYKASVKCVPAIVQTKVWKLGDI
jgi:hypothetical protein